MSVYHLHLTHKNFWFDYCWFQDMLNHIRVFSGKEQKPILAALRRNRIYIQEIGGSQHLWDGQWTRLCYRARNNTPNSSPELSNEGLMGSTQVHLMGYIWYHTSWTLDVPLDWTAVLVTLPFPPQCLCTCCCSLCLGLSGPGWTVSSYDSGFCLNVTFSEKRAFSDHSIHRNHSLQMTPITITTPWVTAAPARNLVHLFAYALVSVSGL